MLHHSLSRDGHSLPNASFGSPEVRREVLRFSYFCFQTAGPFPFLATSDSDVCDQTLSPLLLLMVSPLGLWELLIFWRQELLAHSQLSPTSLFLLSPPVASWFLDISLHLPRDPDSILSQLPTPMVVASIPTITNNPIISNQTPSSGNTTSHLSSLLPLTLWLWQSIHPVPFSLFLWPLCPVLLLTNLGAQPHHSLSLACTVSFLLYLPCSFGKTLTPVKSNYMEIHLVPKAVPLKGVEKHAKLSWWGSLLHLWPPTSTRSLMIPGNPTLCAYSIHSFTFFGESFIPLPSPLNFQYLSPFTFSANNLTSCFPEKTDVIKENICTPMICLPSWTMINHPLPYLGQYPSGCRRPLPSPAG